MANTIVEWFRMIWQLRIVIVVCLVDPDNPAVCERYFRTSEGGSLKVRCEEFLRNVTNILFQFVFSLWCDETRIRSTDDELRLLERFDGIFQVKHRFHVRTISVREEDYGITNYELRLTNKLSAEKHRTLYVISMPTKVCAVLMLSFCSSN